MDGLQRVEQVAGPSCAVCPLSRVQTGVTVRIKKLCASPELQNRLREMGLHEEQIISLLMSQTSFICQVCNARLAISSKIAQMILVEPLVAQAVPATATTARVRL